MRRIVRSDSIIEFGPTVRPIGLDFKVEKDFGSVDPPMQSLEISKILI